MQKIAVCAEDHTILDWFAASLQKYYQNAPDSFDIQLLNNCEEIMLRMKNRYSPDLIFCKIPSTGIEDIRKIRRLSNNCRLVLIAPSDTYAMAGYTVHAYHYLLQPLQSSDVYRILNELFDSNCNTITLNINCMPIAVPCRNLRFIESDKHHLNFHINNKTLQTIGKLNDYEAILKDKKGFLRCHQSFLVNMDYIVDTRDNNFILAEGTAIPIRRNEALKIKKIYYSHVFEN
jgi:DNA-binding LytR/AlgR family response regulator